MIFIILIKFRKKLTKEDVAPTPQVFQRAGAKMISGYWTLGRYDAVITVEAPDEKAVMKAVMEFGDLVATETLIAVPRDAAIKLL